jgi:hypothetical protein
MAEVVVGAGVARQASEVAAELWGGKENFEPMSPPLYSTHHAAAMWPPFLVSALDSVNFYLARGSWMRAEIA